MSLNQRLSCLRVVTVWVLAMVANLADAATYVVNSGGNAGTGTLRAAIDLANANPGFDTINIAIGSGPRNINLTSALPAITDSVDINGRNQPGYAGAPLIQLDGFNAPDGVNGFVITASGVTISGFSVMRFKDSGIVISGGQGNVIIANHIGLNNGGGAAGNSDYGIFVTSSSGNRFEANVISANGVDGLRIDQAGSVDNLVIGNKIGTNPAGTAALGNSLNGIVLSGARNTTVGGAGANGNVISGNGRNGVAISAGGSGNLLVRNHIGVDAGGGAALGNLWTGVVIDASANNLIGGSEAGQYNVISANGQSGVDIRGAAATGNIVQRGLIGTSLAGTVDLGNGIHGVFVQSGNNQVGSGEFGAGGNLISGNAQDGVRVSAPGVSVRGNRIGTDVNGANAIANAVGVHVTDGAHNTVIGAVNAGNLISGNSGSGIYLDGPTFLGGTSIRSNLIGTSASGLAALGNGAQGVLVSGASATAIEGNIVSANTGDGMLFSVNTASDTLVTGNWVGLAGNLSALGNGQAGVRISTGADVELSVNRIFANGGLGIDLGPIGVAVNDPQDLDFGANGLQNHPVIASAVEIGGNTTVSGNLNSTPDSSFRLDFFTTPICDGSGYGEGSTFATTVIVTTNSSGNAPFSVVIPGIPAGGGFTATATSATPRVETSEFSPCVVSSTPAAQIAFSLPSSSAAETAGSVAVLLSRSVNTASAVSVRVDSTSFSATAGVDYQAIVAQVVNFAPGQTSQQVLVSILDDNITEPNEALRLDLSSPSPGAVLGSQTQHTLTITSEDPVPTVTVDNGGCSVTEGHAGPIDCHFVVRLSRPSSVGVSFRTTTGGISAHEGVDFTSHFSVQRAIEAGQTALTVNVPVIGDLMDEDTESFRLSLSSVINATPSSLEAIGSIVDDDDAPTLSIDNNSSCSIVEGNGGISYCTFVLRLSAPTSRVVSFSKTALSGTATLGTDFGNNSELGQFAAGQQTLSITMPVFVDTIYEYNETFSLQIGSVQNATPAALTGTGTIVNDDAVPAFTLTPCVVTETDSASVPCVVGLTLARAAERPVLLAYYTESPGNRLAPTSDASFENPVVGAQSAFYDAGSSVGAWLVESGNVELKSWMQWQAAHFRQSIDMHGNLPGSIGRDIATVPGQRYVLSFAQSGHPICEQLNTTMTVDFGTQALGSFAFNASGNTTASMGWRYQSRSVVANSTTTRLRFSSATAGYCGPALDDIGLSPVGVASSGVDYAAIGVYAETPLSMPAGATLQSFTVPVLADNEIEGTEDFILRVCAVDGGCQNAVVGIDDDDMLLPDPVFKNGFE